MVVRENVLEYIIALVVVKNKVRLNKCLKTRFYAKNLIFSNFRGRGARRVRPPGSAPGTLIQKLINIDRRKLVEILVLILKK
jgi:hypothetical protein